MPKVSVKVPHGGDPKDIVKKIQTALEKTVGNFEGHDLSIDWQDTTGQFHFKSLGFTIAGTAQVDQDQVAVDIDRKSTRLNSSHTDISRMPSSA